MCCGHALSFLLQMQSSHEQQLKALAKMLPNYHKLLKPTTPSAAPVA